jgi:hypothetical protein
MKILESSSQTKQRVKVSLCMLVLVALSMMSRTEGQSVVQHPPNPTPTPSPGHPVLKTKPTPRPAAGRVTGVVVSVSAPSHYTCPVQESFSGSIAVNGATDVTYTWVSFDGGTWPQGTLHFTGPGRQTVHEQVKVGATGQVIHGWMQLKVLSPNAVLSRRGAYTVSCKTTGRVVAAHLTPAYSTATPCPRQVNLNGTITANGAADVTYTWMSSDNSTWPKSTLHFTGAGTQPARETWTIGTPGQNVSQWARLKVLSPNAFMSNSAPLRFRCPGGQSAVPKKIVKSQAGVKGESQDQQVKPK